MTIFTSLFGVSEKKIQELFEERKALIVKTMTGSVKKCVDNFYDFAHPNNRAAKYKYAREDLEDIRKGLDLEVKLLDRAIKVIERYTTQDKEILFQGSGDKEAYVDIKSALLNTLNAMTMDISAMSDLIGDFTEILRHLFFIGSQGKVKTTDRNELLVAVKRNKEFFLNEYRKAQRGLKKANVDVSKLEQFSKTWVVKLSEYEQLVKQLDASIDAALKGDNSGYNQIHALIKKIYEMAVEFVGEGINKEEKVEKQFLATKGILIRRDYRFFNLVNALKKVG